MNGSDAGKAEAEYTNDTSGIQLAGYLHWNGEYYERLDCCEIRGALYGSTTAARPRSRG